MSSGRVSKPAACTLIHGDALRVAGDLTPGQVQLLYLDPPFFSGKVRRNAPGGPQYDDRWPGGMVEYLAFLRALIGAAKPVLAPTGVIALHLDWRASHHGRVELERVFGEKQFVNEIIWAYKTGGAGKRFLARKHDTICVYAAGPKWKFHPQREKSHLAHRYGFKNIQIHQDERGPYTWAAMRDVWDIPALRGNQREAVGYPTQKPLALLTRLVDCFSDPDDLVADLCCGSGTALVAALRQGRRALGADSSATAFSLAASRLRQCCGPERAARGSTGTLVW